MTALPRERKPSRMLHHIDIHVSDIAAACALFDAIAPAVGYRRLRDSDDLEEPGFVGYETADGGRPRIGFIPDADLRTGSTRVAFACKGRDGVNAAAERARAAGARALDGPSVHREYGEYYAVFFEDPDGNKYEITASP
jgi:glyoxylase I family protein